MVIYFSKCSIHMVSPKTSELVLSPTFIPENEAFDGVFDDHSVCKGISVFSCWSKLSVSGSCSYFFKYKLDLNRCIKGLWSESVCSDKCNEEYLQCVATCSSSECLLECSRAIATCMDCKSIFLYKFILLIYSL